MTAGRRSRPQHRRLPRLWTAAETTRLVSVTALAATIIALAWFLAAGRGTEQAQIPDVFLAIGGALAAMAGAFRWLLLGRRRIQRRLRLLTGELP